MESHHKEALVNCVWYARRYMELQGLHPEEAGSPVRLATQFLTEHGVVDQTHEYVCKDCGCKVVVEKVRCSTCSVLSRVDGEGEG